MPPTLSQDRLVRKETALGTLREKEPPQNHIGLRLFAPWMPVFSDDVIFSYTRGITAGMTPARAEDAESELAGRDDSTGTGRASMVDWAEKNHYDASDVTRYQEALILGGIAEAANLPLTVQRGIAEFAGKVAKDTALRRRKLDNRLEWLIMTPLDTGHIVYDDGNMAWDTDYGRPDSQQDFACPESPTIWGLADSDPIEDILAVQATARDDHDISLKRAIISDKAWRAIRKSEKFRNGLLADNPMYVVRGWGEKAAADFVADQTAMEFIVYDSVWRTRPLGSNTTTNNRFTREDYVIFLPSQADIDEIDDDIGFGKMMTSPHAEGNWESGFYEWELETKDPWGRDVGSGVKAYPILPHLDYTYVMKVL